MHLMLSIDNMENRKPKTYSDSKQTMWETWFVLSVIIVFAYLVVGVMIGSEQQFPNWDIFAVLAIVNLLVCLYKGSTIKH
jgi:membrane protein YdbS with pleckstrin-like domain